MIAKAAWKKKQTTHKKKQKNNPCVLKAHGELKEQTVSWAVLGLEQTVPTVNKCFTFLNCVSLKRDWSQVNEVLKVLSVPRFVPLCSFNLCSANSFYTKKPCTSVLLNCREALILPWVARKKKKQMQKKTPKKPNTLIKLAPTSGVSFVTTHLIACLWMRNAFSHLLQSHKQRHIILLPWLQLFFFFFCAFFLTNICWVYFPSIFNFADQVLLDSFGCMRLSSQHFLIKWYLCHRASLCAEPSPMPHYRQL